MMKCEICEGEFESVDKHHIQSKSKGGTNNKSNIAYVCANHHRMIHLGLIVLEGRFDSVPKGEVLVWRKYTAESITGVPDPDVYIIKRK